MRALLVVLLVGCKAPEARQLDKSLIRVTNDANLRTDTIGSGTFTDLATFVLVEAENTSKEGAYVTLGGELTDADDHVIGPLRAQSLWIPARELRTFALIDKERKPRPSAKAAHIYVRGASVPTVPPPMIVASQRQLEDGDKIVVQGSVKNTAARGGNVMVLATFYGVDNRPMTRPFSMLWIPANADQSVQFVGPPGSKRGTIFLGDMAY